MTDLKLVNAEKTFKIHKDFKKITCLTKEEECMITEAGRMISTRKRYKYSFATVKNDIGLGAQTGDLIQPFELYSMDGDKFETGKTYQIEIREA